MFSDDLQVINTGVLNMKNDLISFFQPNTTTQQPEASIFRVYCMHHIINAEEFSFECECLLFYPLCDDRNVGHMTNMLHCRN